MFEVQICVEVTTLPRHVYHNVWTSYVGEVPVRTRNLEILKIPMLDDQWHCCWARSTHGSLSCIFATFYVTTDLLLYTVAVL